MPTDFHSENAHGSGTVKSWASLCETNTLEQAQMLSRHRLVRSHVALMPDAHLGRGATVGCVTPMTRGIIPSVVGVDIGCGMDAVRTDLLAAELTGQDRRLLLDKLRATIPSGVGKGRLEVPPEWPVFTREHPLTRRAFQLSAKAGAQFGTLGSGNHFAEFSEDEQGYVWAVVHSGSRGIGNKLAQYHIETAKQLTKYEVEHIDLSYLPSGTQQFEHYIEDMLWAQAYARAQRAVMLDRMLHALYAVAPYGWGQTVRVSCHHNYSLRLDDDTWLSRKGAIAAGPLDWGVIPGSMGTDTYIVQGKGNEDAYSSAPHGAGRQYSRGSARRTLDVDEFSAQMGGRVWQDRDAVKLLDEAPDAYKPIETVMDDASDLVDVRFVLSAFVNYKGL